MEYDDLEQCFQCLTFSQNWNESEVKLLIKMSWIHGCITLTDIFKSKTKDQIKKILNKIYKYNIVNIPINFTILDDFPDYAINKNGIISSDRRK